MKNIKFRAFYFSLRVWITTVLVAPALYAIIQAYIEFLNDTYSHQIHFDPSIYLFMVILELIFSFVIWIMFWAITEAIVYSYPNEEVKRWLIFSAAMLLTIVPFIILAGFTTITDPGNFMFTPLLTNAFCIGCGCWIYKLQ
jgi:hypothetical protein